MVSFKTYYSMANKIEKNDDLYREALIWMGYRYAIGLTESKAPYHTISLREEFIVEDEI